EKPEKQLKKEHLHPRGAEMSFAGIRKSGNVEFLQLRKGAVADIRNALKKARTKLIPVKGFNLFLFAVELTQKHEKTTV
ncbi:MAG: hypothetical protein RSC76_10630, partial [Oscillospiraceae bacterium]